MNVMKEQRRREEDGNAHEVGADSPAMPLECAFTLGQAAAVQVWACVPTRLTEAHRIGARRQPTSGLT